MPSLKVKRGTKSQIDSAATSNLLNIGEPYLITDKNCLAIGTSVNSYSQAAMALGGLINIEVVSALPSPPDANTLYIVTG